MKSDTELANLFNAFAHPKRIAILRALLMRCPNGCRFGDIASTVRISPSTLTHHLQEMERAGVLRREASGRSTILNLNLANLADAATQLAQLCCSVETAPNPQNEGPDV